VHQVGDERSYTTMHGQPTIKLKKNRIAFYRDTCTLL